MLVCNFVVEREEASSSKSKKKSTYLSLEDKVEKQKVRDMDLKETKAEKEEKSQNLFQKNYYTSVNDYKGE